MKTESSTGLKRYFLKSDGSPFVSYKVGVKGRISAYVKECGGQICLVDIKGEEHFKGVEINLESDTFKEVSHREAINALLIKKIIGD